MSRPPRADSSQTPWSPGYPGPGLPLKGPPTTTAASAAIAPTVKPKRIWIVGHSGSGKSAVADRLAAHLGIEPTHLDEIHWLPGWKERSPEEEIEIVRPIVARDRWVIEGNYTPVREQFIDRTELNVWLYLPLRITFPRVLKRTFKRALHKELSCNGNRESLAKAFFTRDSILLWTLQMDRWRRRTLTEELEDLPHVRFSNQRDVDRWLTSVAATGRFASSTERQDMCCPACMTGAPRSDRHKDQHPQDVVIRQSSDCCNQSDDRGEPER
ncbi:MAG: hypothetical protein JSV91_07265 [Phycisphaerales bacterium]|nr:MAG: hypothetical protein JSV91_07265 [Phycisphaerales bacterium]